jgi:hypothetical protein
MKSCNSIRAEGLFLSNGCVITPRNRPSLIDKFPTAITDRRKNAGPLSLYIAQEGVNFSVVHLGILY